MVVYLSFFNLLTIFTMMPAIRLRLTRIHNDEEKNVAIKTMGLFKLNEITRMDMPKIKEDSTRSEDRKKANHQKKDFIKTYDTYS